MKRMWSEEEIQAFKKDISTLVDSKGNPRFVEGEGTPAIITGLNTTYCKWSLSGTHLMCVFAGSFENASVIPASAIIVTFTLPNFIKDKIQAIWGGNRIEYKTLNLYADDWSAQNMQLQTIKTNQGVSLTTTGASLTLTAKRNFRLQIDMLIDSE